MFVLKNFLAIILLALSGSTAMAHALFIETASQAQVDQFHPVRIIYSEPDGSELEPVEKWYSNVASFKLYLIAPDGSRSLLETTPSGSHFSAGFTPKTEGIYRLEISHTAEKPGNGTVYQFNALAQVQAGAALTQAPLSGNMPELTLLENKEAEQRGHFTVFLKGKPAEGIEAAVHFEDGSHKTFSSDAHGQLRLPLDSPGIYTIEATQYTEGESGKTTDHEYSNTWRCATQKIEIK